MLAALALRELESFDTQAAAKKNVRAAIESVASRLGNKLRENLASLRPEEAAVLGLLEARLKRTLTGALEDSLTAVRQMDSKRSKKQR